MFFCLVLGAEFVTGALAWIAAQVFPAQIMALFGAASESVYYVQFAMKAFRVYLCLLPLATVNKGVFIFLQAMGKAAASTFLSMVRELGFGVGFALLLPWFYGLDGVLYSMPLSDALTFVLSLISVVRTLKSLHGPVCDPVCRPAGVLHPAGVCRGA